MDALPQIINDFVLFILVLLLFLAFFVYMVVSIVDEDDNYEINLLSIGEKSYLLVKEKQKLRKH